MFNEKGVKEAFERVKLDIFNLGNELSSLRQEMYNLKSQLSTIDDSLSSLKLSSLISQVPAHIPTDRQTNQAYPAYPTDNPTVPVEVKGLKYQNLDISTRNIGVPTDRQTNQQTNQQTDLPSRNAYPLEEEHLGYLKPTSISTGPIKQTGSVSSGKDSFSRASEILDSLDEIKKEIRLKFKHITQQEMLVFSSIYQLEEKFSEGVEYRQIATKLGLSESSIRDYVQKIIAKGVPILKTKLNNKKILLTVSSELKKMASLDTLIKLREL